MKCHAPILCKHTRAWLSVAALFCKYMRQIARRCVARSWYGAVPYASVTVNRPPRSEEASLRPWGDGMPGARMGGRRTQGNPRARRWPPGVGARLIAGIVAGTCATLVATPTALAYEYSLRVATLGQSYQLRGFWPSSGNRFWSRARVTQAIDLTVRDLGGFAPARRLALHPGVYQYADAGPQVSLHLQLRLDHDFGTWTFETLRPAGRARDALDLLPELSASALALQVLAGYVRYSGWWQGRGVLDVGRQGHSDGFEWFAIDGATLTAAPTRGLDLAVTAGWRVRAASPLGWAGWELDGTSGAGCMEYVEGATPGTGVWQLIVRDTMVRNRRLVSDLLLCPEREQAQPTLATTAAFARGPFTASVGYRRTMSPTVGLIGAVDRYPARDEGLFPNEAGQAPGWAVNQEVVWWHANAQARPAGTLVRGFVDGRANLVARRLDRGLVGVVAQRRRQQWEASADYTLPVFDADSLFAIFAVDPALHWRVAHVFTAAPTTRLPGSNLGGLRALGWSGRMGGVQTTQPLTLRSELWLRQFVQFTGLDATTVTAADASASATAAGRNGSAASYGGSLAVTRGMTPRLAVRASLLGDGGYGGRRFAATTDVMYAAGNDLNLLARSVTLVQGRDALVAGPTGVAGPLQPSAVTQSLVANAMWRPSDFVGLASQVEWYGGGATGNEVRGFLQLSLGFVPEQ